MRILLCFGTRPEAIKMVSVYHQLKVENDVKVCVTAQHREMLDQVLDFFEIISDYDLDLMVPNQSLNNLSARILFKIDEVFIDSKPELVLVHGDTTTTAMISLAAFHMGIKVGHVEAGLRTFNKHAPFPEEINRQITSRIADFHFTPTAQATQNLIKEGVLTKYIIETGNTVIDALLWTVLKIEKNDFRHGEVDMLKKILPTDKKIILVTGHRRENFGDGFVNICEAILSLSRRKDVIIVYPVHLNPKVKSTVYELLSNKRNIELIEPLSYPSFIWLMQQSYLIISDSGGIQEEAPSLCKPVLVTRTVSERVEGITSGFSILVGTNKETIIKEADYILDNLINFDFLRNPYGNGDAAKKIAEYIKKYKITK